MLPNLKRLRQECRISQQRLAEIVGVSQQSINQYENHQVEPDIEMLTRLAAYFDTSIDYIVGRTEVRRRIEETEPYHLNAEEAQLIARYRALRPKEKACIACVMETLLEEGDRKK